MKNRLVSVKLKNSRQELQGVIHKIGPLVFVKYLRIHLFEAFDWSLIPNLRLMMDVINERSQKREEMKIATMKMA